MRRIVLAGLFALVLVGGARAQDSGFDFGRFHFGMTTQQIKAAAPEQQWVERKLGVDLVVLQPATPIVIAGNQFYAMFSFRDGPLTRIEFQSQIIVASKERCGELLENLAYSIEASIGAFDAPPDPAELGAMQSTRTTPAGSILRFYDHDAVDLSQGFATYEGAYFAALQSEARHRSGELVCELDINMRPDAPPHALDMPPPTADELAHATSVRAHWAAQPDITAFEFATPPMAVYSGASGTATLDCLVVQGGRINCAVASEDPSGQYFGEGALALARYYRIADTIGGASTLGKRVSLTIHFSNVHGEGQ